MDPTQRQRPHEIIDRIGREAIDARAGRDNGYMLYVRPGSRNRFGYVRFNIQGRNKDMFTLYALRYESVDDPDNRFNHDAAPAQHCHSVWPDDEDGIRYALRVLRASYDRASV